MANNTKRLQPDADYLKSEAIGVEIAKGMAALYKQQP